MQVLLGPMALTLSAVEPERTWEKDIVRGDVRSTLKNYRRHCEAGTMDGFVQCLHLGSGSRLSEK